MLFLNIRSGWERKFCRDSVCLFKILLKFYSVCCVLTPDSHLFQEMLSLPLSLTVGRFYVLKKSSVFYRVSVWGVKARHCYDPWYSRRSFSSFLPSIPRPWMEMLAETMVLRWRTPPLLGGRQVMRSSRTRYGKSHYRKREMKETGLMSEIQLQGLCSVGDQNFRVLYLLLHARLFESP